MPRLATTLSVLNVQRSTLNVHSPWVISKAHSLEGGALVRSVFFLTVGLWLTLTSYQARVYELKGTGGRYVLKVEEITERARIPHEFKIYCLLKNISAVPEVRNYCKQKGQYVMVMENAGINLPDYLSVRRWVLRRLSRKEAVVFFASKMVCMNLLLFTNIPLRIFLSALGAVCSPFKGRHPWRHQSSQFRGPGGRAGSLHPTD